jgi:sigma-B regulation protein RsbU (phosphoserine phosphatase)
VTILAGVVLGFSGIQIFKLAPTWGAVLSMCIIAWVFSYAFIRYELTTVVIGSFVMIGLWKAWPFLSMGDAVHVGNGLVSLALLAVPFVLGYISLKGKESVEQMEEYIPPYMARAMEQERMKQELEIARRVQRSFLPRRKPQIEKIDIAAVCVPANEVGGDYYDFIPMGPHRIGLVIGDVSGKGVSAAFYMALMKGFLRAEAANLDSPKSILSKVNARFYENSDPNVFISMVYGVLDSRQRTLTYARAGHNPVILHRTAEGTSQSFSPPGLALGLDNGQIFDRVIAEETIRLDAGDVLVFYTDGFTEASNWRKEEFGEERLLALIEKNKEKDAAGIISSIEEEIRSFIGETAQWDDMTMVVAKIL